MNKKIVLTIICIAMVSIFFFYFKYNNDSRSYEIAFNTAEERQNNVKFIRFITEVHYISEERLYIDIKSTKWKNVIIEKIVQPKEIRKGDTFYMRMISGDIPLQERFVRLMNTIFLLIGLFTPVICCFLVAWLIKKKNDV